MKNYSVFPDDEGRRFSVYYMELDPGSFWRSDPHIVGTIEFITLIRGTLEIVAGEQTFTIRPRGEHPLPRRHRPLLSESGPRLHRPAFDHVHPLTGFDFITALCYIEHTGEHLPSKQSG